LFVVACRAPPRSPLFPYTTLFRSALEQAFLDAGGNRVGGGRARRTGVVARHPAGAVPDRVVADAVVVAKLAERLAGRVLGQLHADRKSTRLNSSHVKISYAVFCLK